MKQTIPKERIPPPNDKIRAFMYVVAVHVMFEVIVNTLIVINMVPIILELSSDDDAPYMGVLTIINYVYCTIYIAEAAWKVCTYFCWIFTAWVALNTRLKIGGRTIASGELKLTRATKS